MEDNLTIMEGTAAAASAAAAASNNTSEEHASPTEDVHGDDIVLVGHRLSYDNIEQQHSAAKPPSHDSIANVEKDVTTMVLASPSAVASAATPSESSFSLHASQISGVSDIVDSLVFKTEHSSGRETWYEPDSFILQQRTTTIAKDSKNVRDQEEVAALIVEGATTMTDKSNMTVSSSKNNDAAEKSRHVASSPSDEIVASTESSLRVGYASPQQSLTSAMADNKSHVVVGSRLHHEASQYVQSKSTTAHESDATVPPPPDRLSVPDRSNARLKALSFAVALVVSFLSGYYYNKWQSSPTSLGPMSTSSSMLRLSAGPEDTFVPAIPPTESLSSTALEAPTMPDTTTTVPKTSTVKEAKDFSNMAGLLEPPIVGLEPVSAVDLQEPNCSSVFAPVDDASYSWKDYPAVDVPPINMEDIFPHSFACFDSAYVLLFAFIGVAALGNVVWKFPAWQGPRTSPTKGATRVKVTVNIPPCNEYDIMPLNERIHLLRALNGKDREHASREELEEEVRAFLDGVSVKKLKDMIGNGAGKKLGCIGQLVQSGFDASDIELHHMTTKGLRGLLKRSRLKQNGNIEELRRRLRDAGVIQPLCLG